MPIGRVFAVNLKGFSGTKDKIMKPQFEKSLSGEYFLFSLGSVELKLKSRHMCCLFSILKTLCLTDINLVSMETVLSIVLPSCVVIPSSFHVLADCNCTDLAIYSWKGHNIFSQVIYEGRVKSIMYIFFIFLLQEPMIRLGVLITWWSLYLWSALRKPKLPSRSGSYHLWSR